MINQKIREVIERQLKGKRKITFLVGAGLSSESGVPTFRDIDGYWKKGSENYTPQEMGTLKMFNVNSNKVWNWYLNRIQLTKIAKPNIGHLAISEVQKLYPNRFTLISQNVDGLHFKSGMIEKDLYLIHGDLRYMRCSEACTDDLYLIPDKLLNRGKKDDLTFDEIELIKCPNCGDICRPHVLWFDENYNEKFYKLNSVQRIAKETGLLFIIGTSGATTLPKIILNLALSKSSVVIDINPNSNNLTDIILKSKNGYWIQERSGKVLSEIFFDEKSKIMITSIIILIIIQ